jgi:hypothetical protein
MIKITPKLYRKFTSNVVLTDNKCWLWTGDRNYGGKYGGFSWKGKIYYAHRLAVTLFLDPNYDPIGRGWKGDQVLHDCDVKLCVSPHCLRPGTRSENVIDDYARHKYRRSKLSRAMSGSGNPFFGHSHSDETKRKIGESSSKRNKGFDNPMYGKHHSRKTRREMSKTIRDSERNKGPNNPMYGKHHSRKTRMKISKTKRDGVK